MKTSLGIWALGPMVTRFVPGGYQPEHDYEREPTSAKVTRAIEGLGDLIDGYEFHYPQELSEDNLAEVSDALGDHDVYTVCTGLHLDPRFGKGGLCSPDPGVRAEALAATLRVADFAGRVGAHMVCWPGIEGYNYPFQTPYAQSWEWFLDGMAQTAERCRERGVTLFLEHKNSEPAMKILMRNIGMTLHVIHTLRRQGIDNVQVNMDWQHLIMNGENLAEYAALLQAEGLLGHQHANSGWGTFDDDNMVGATAFMETLELALELRRAGYGRDGDGRRLGFDLYPYTEDQVGAVARSVRHFRFIDDVAGRLEGEELRAAQQRKDAVRAYELVYAALGERARMIAVGLDVGTTSVKGLALDTDTGEVVAAAASEYPYATPQPGWAEQDPALWWTATEEVLGRLADEAGAAGGIGLSGQMHGLVALDGDDAVLRPALLWNDQRTGRETAEIEERLGGPEGVAKLTGNRALTGFTAPKLAWMARHEPERYERIASILLPKDYVRLRLCGERATDVTDASGTLWFDPGRRAWSDEVLRALEVDAAWLPAAEESPTVTGATPEGVPVAAGAGDQGAGALGVGADRPGPASVVLGTSGVVLAALEAPAADAQARLQSSCHVMPQGWFVMGVILSAAGSLRWLRDATGGASYEDLLAEADAWPPGVEGLTFLPHLTGERTPHADPDARGAFAGLTVRHDRGALVRAVLEGVAFAMRDALDLVADVGERPRSGRISGGGGRGGLWLRILASVLELPLERVAVDEGAAYGAALLGGVAAGAWADPGEAVQACVRTRGDAVEPVSDWVEPYAEARERYRALYPAVRPLEG